MTFSNCRGVDKRMRRIAAQTVAVNKTNHGRNDLNELHKEIRHQT